MLIYDKINPLTISKITTSRFFREGRHPVFYRFRNKKHPILSIFWDGAPSEWDGVWQRPAVNVHGANGAIILTIPARSNDHANMLAAELKQQLEDALNKLVRKE